MSDPRAALQGIQERADKARFYIAADMDAWPVGRSAADVPKLVAALRAVLDELERCERVTEEARNQPWSSVRYMPAVAEVTRVRELITEALGRTDA